MEDDDRQSMYYEQQRWEEDQEEMKAKIATIKKTSLKAKLLGCISHALVFINDFTDPAILYKDLEVKVNRIIDETELFI